MCCAVYLKRVKDIMPKNRDGEVLRKHLLSIVVGLHSPNTDLQLIYVANTHTV